MLRKTDEILSLSSPCFPVLSPNTVKCVQEKIPILD